MALSNAAAPYMSVLFQCSSGFRYFALLTARIILSISLNPGRDINTPPTLLFPNDLASCTLFTTP